MVRVGSLLVVRAFDPSARREVLTQRELEPFAVETPAEVVHLVLLEYGKRAAHVKRLAAVPRANNRRLVALLRLVDGRCGDAVPHLVVGRTDSESVQLSQNK